MELVTEWLLKVRTVLDVRLFSVGNQDITLIRVFLIVLAVVAFLTIRHRVHAASVAMARKRIKDEKSAHAFGQLVNVVMWLVAIVFILDVSGVGFSSIAAVLAALGVGIGFGLQNLINNSVSGLVMLFEQPVRVGDIIEVNGEFGLVQEIGWRATRLVNWDNIEVMIPNSVLLENNLVNWTLSDPTSRISVEFGVHYKSDRALVVELAIMVAAGTEGVEANPEPSVLLKNFGDSSLDYVLNIWTREPWRRNFIAADVRESLMAAFVANGVEIPFPQRDINFRNAMPETTK